MSMVAFHALFPVESESECRRGTPHDHPVLPVREFVFAESYCADPGCDCRRVLLSVFDMTTREQVATIAHGFDPPNPRHRAMGQTFLDPLNPQSPWSAAFLQMFKDMVADPEDPYAARLERHYAMWKAVVDDPSHPRNGALRERFPGAGMLPPQTTVRREGPKIGANDACPCGSGKKYKRCCRP